MQNTSRARRRLSIESFSVGGVVTTVFALLGLTALVQSLLAGVLYQEKAMNAEAETLRKVVSVASRGVMEKLAELTMEFGLHLSNQPALVQALRWGSDTEAAEQAASLLDDPFINGFPNNDRLSLEKLRLFSLNGELLVASQRGLRELPPRLAPALAERVLNRTGVDRLQAVSGIWSTPNGPRFSLVIPAGGLRASGYLEVVMDPLFNLPQVGDMVQLPVSVDLADHADGHGPAWRKLSADDIVVDYILPTLDDRPAYRISTRLSLLEFNAEVEDTALLLFLTHVTSAAIALLLAYLVLMRFLIRPVQRMCANIYRALDTTELPPVSTRGLSEFHQLALSFNRLMEDVHRNRSNLENLSLTDELTQLANRRAFNSMLEREWARSCRYELEISLLLIDIDYFKKYNDHYGHQAGDQVLRQVAEVLRKTVQRREDLAARYGGEEFAIVLATTGLDSALVLAERVRRGVEELAIPHAGSEVADCLTLSIGVASCTPLGSGESGCFVECADRALYRAKEAGRNGLQWIERDELRQCVRVCSEAGCDDNGPTEERG